MTERKTFDTGDNAISIIRDPADGSVTIEAGAEGGNAYSGFYRLTKRFKMSADKRRELSEFLRD